MSEVVGAGWYPDSTSGHEFRYWDGQVWTNQVSDNGVVSEFSPAVAPAQNGSAAFDGGQPAAGSPTTSSKLRSRLTFVLVGAGAILLGALLPWASQNNGFTTTTISGTSTGGGGISIFLALVIAAIAGMTLSRGFGRGSVIATLLLGCLELVVVIGNFADLANTMDEELQQGLPEGTGTSPGAGLVIALIGAGIVVVASLLALRAAKRP